MQCSPRLSIASRRERRGATLVESAIVLSICAALLLGMCEMSVAVVRYTTVCEAARRIARAAIVHGSMAPTELGQWGTEQINVRANHSSPVASVAREALMAIDPADAIVEISWPDDSNEPNARVEVTVRYTHQPMVDIPGVFSSTELVGKSTMHIAH